MKPAAAILASLLGAPGLLHAADALSVHAIAEVEREVTEGEHETRKLVPADRVVAADHVIFTLAVRNTGTSTIEAPEFMYAIPKHMTYVADSAVGPGVEVTYSVDGGQHFAQAEKLVVVVDGRPRPAVAADYSHIHWQMRGRLKGHSVAFVRFRTIAQ